MRHLYQYCRIGLMMLAGLGTVSVASARWPVGGGGDGDDDSRRVIVAPSDAVYEAGTFRNVGEFGDVEVSSEGSSDVYIVRYSNAGLVEWVATAGGASVDQISDIVLDDGENLYVVGNFYGTIRFTSGGLSGGVGPLSLDAEDGYSDIFIARLAADGSWDWVRRAGGRYGDEGRAIDFHSGDDTVLPPVPASIFVGGKYNCDFALFDDTNAVEIGPLDNGNCSGSSDYDDLFIARIDTDGNWMWVKDFENGAWGRDGIDVLKVAANGEVFVSGPIRSGAGGADDFNPTPEWSLVGPGHESDHTFFVPNREYVTDQSLYLNPSFNLVHAHHPKLEFYHHMNSENNYDGGILEYSRNGGGWTYFSGSFESGGYNTHLSDRTENPIGGRWAWGNYFSGWWLSIADLSSLSDGSYRFRWRYATDYSQKAWGWEVDDVRLYDDFGTIFDSDMESVSTATHVSRLSHTLAADPSAAPPVWDWVATVPTSIRFSDIEINSSGRVVLVGNTTAPTTLEPGITISTAGTAIATFRPTSSGPDWTAAAGAEGSTGNSLTLDEEDAVYITGSFSGSKTFGSTTLESAGGSDIYTAKLDSGLFWQWAKRAGGSSDDIGSDIDTSGEIITVDGSPQVADLFVTGSFEDQAAFGTDDCSASPEQCLQSAGGSDAFVADMVSEKWSSIEGWTAGDEIIPPEGAYVSQVTSVPEFYQGGVSIDAISLQLVLWVHDGISGHEGRLYALQPTGELEIRWHVSADPLNNDRIPQIGSIMWPQKRCQPGDDGSCFQVHIAGSPVEIEPPSGGYTYLTLINPSTDSSSASVDESKVFRAPAAGYSVVLYTIGDTSDVATEVVRTFTYDSAPDYVDGKAWTIGTEITDTDHDEIGRNGFVVNAQAFFDPWIYDRDARTGPIIPVNRVSSYRSQDASKHMVVVWYRKNFKNVFWGVKPVRYDCTWPAVPEKIIIASEQGSEVLGQSPLDPLLYPSKQLYNQPDPSMAGYNPNDEHALFAPSNTGSGVEALFALRADFGSNLAGDLTAASDPYCLIKYRDPNTQSWRFRVFQILATGAGFDAFHYTGTAGTTVSPPYPMRLLPACEETQVLGERDGDPQPPAPFFRDYSSTLWAKSAGNGAIAFHYPLQPTFVYDVDNDDVPDVPEGQCVPWQPRLAEADGGTSNPEDPILVFYSISWPTDIPTLEVGETLLKPKRGLPEIYNQQAVRVVYDQAYEDALEDQVYDPDRRLVRLIEPLSERALYFDPADPPSDPDPTVCYGLGGLPSDIATETDTSGKQVILGSADGLIKLPYVLKSRLRYDPLNHKLKFKGSFDDSGAGEPLLLLNVMTQGERDQLKQLSADANWDTCVDKMYDYSRNPEQLDLVTQPCSVSCTEYHLFGISIKICRPSDCGSRDGEIDQALRIGFEDSNDDGYPEPIEGSGPGHALTAGFAKGTGYVTVAFNDDPTLAPLPVSLNIIKVDCLRYPEDADPPDLLSTYIGEIKVIQSDNVFDEQLTLRHSGDFAGQADNVEFEWYFHPDEDGTPPTPLPDPENGQMNGWQRFPLDDPFGANEITIGGANVLALSDNWFVVRYRGLDGCNNQSEWSVWAGQPGSTPLEPRAQLAEGWVKRVVRGLNPFETRVKQFHKSATNTFASMLMQLGPRYEGDIALNSDPDNLNNVGLIEAYETVLRRAEKLSIDSTPPVDYEPANAAILNVTSRIVDFYTLLGNEAYADALDPTVGISTDNPTFDLGSLAPTIFNFENQTSSLLEEELDLLRGRDDSQGPVAARPVYNRLYWNFTDGAGEDAYALSYNIYDVHLDGVLDEKDAKILYPQGHGDAWGHYLTAETSYYNLLRHPFYSWNPRPEAVLVAGVPIQVDYFDERKFAKVAAAKARTGADLVNLTYRQNYVEDPGGQWQGYKDTDPERAWGLSGWGKRAGIGAYLDWVTVNAILPAEDSDPTHVGIQIIDREHNDEIDEIATAYQDIQTQIDSADRGLNPLGLAKGVVPFDIDPSEVDEGKTHFEQIYERATDAMDNVVAVWDFANRLNKMLRFNQDTTEDMTANSRSYETSFKNKLIEIFGYPYDGDDLYPADYDGPDLYHYMYTDPPALEGTLLDLEIDDPDSNMEPVQPVRIINATYNPMPAGVGFFDLVGEKVNLNCGSNPLGDGCNLGKPGDLTLDVEYRVWESLDSGLSFPKPGEWGNRRATGKLQDALAEISQSEIELKKALRRYNNHMLDIKDLVDTMAVTYNIRKEQIKIKNDERKEINQLEAVIETAKTAGIAARRTADGLRKTWNSAEKCVPDNMIVGLAGGGDLFSTIKCSMESVESVSAFVFDVVGDAADVAANITASSQADIPLQAAIETQVQDARLELFNMKGEFDHMMREEPVLRAEVFSLAEKSQQAVKKYYKALAEGQRTLASLFATRRNTAAAVQEYRYEDMAFRIFRNDALSKYRSAFDMAARYAYLAATAYDYETNLLGSDAEAGQAFLTDIVRERSIGQILNHEPVPGSRGLADPLGRMKQNFAVLKGQMGFNNPQIETNRFSLRSELFRIPEGEEGDEAWREVLRKYRVDDLWTVKAFRRYCRPFAPESAGPQPGLVIPMSSTVTFGLNFFGWPLGPGDSAYDPTHFATRVRGVGTWFGNYAELPLSNTPRVYLIPTGADVLRSPSADNFETREWTVVDQVLPVPFPIGAGDLDDENWIPLEDMLSGPFGEIRRFSSFRAHHFSEPFDDSEIISDSRLIGRSVWNTQWLLIIPGGTLLYDPEEGLDTFIEGQEIPGSSERDGNGVNDIKLFFETYAYSGN